MIYLFRDLFLDKEVSKIEANSKKEAVLKIIEQMIDNGDIYVETLCNCLDLEIVGLKNE